MVRRNGAEVRKERIERIARRVLSMLEKYDGEIPLSKTISALAYESGLTKERIREYLSILEELDRFILDIERGKICKIAEEKKA